MSGIAVAFAPLLPWSGLAALAALAAATVALGIPRRAPGTLWRALAAAGILLALADPALVAERRQALPDIALVVVDDSASQDIGERRARAGAALDAIRQRLGDRADLELRIVRAGGAGSGHGDGTLLFAALDAALADVPRRRLAGAVLLTDGRVHDAPAALPDPGAPLHALITGARDTGDRRLTVVEAPQFGIVGAPVRLVIRVDDDPPGAAAGDARVTVRRSSAAGPEAGGGATGGTGGDVREMVVAVGRAHAFEASLDRGGPGVFEIAVGAGPRELTLANNRAVVVVAGVRDRLRVLLVSGEPHPGGRTWRNLLKADPSVDLVHFTILRPPDRDDGTPADELSLIGFPTRELFEVKLADFDLVVFDRYRRRGLLPLQHLANIADYVSGGGALLEAAGPSFAAAESLYRTPLGAVLPGVPTGEVLHGRYLPEVTGAGRRHPVTAALDGAGADGEPPSWGPWFRQVEVTPRSGSVLLDGAGGRPLLQLDRVGEGRVAQLNSDHMWLWTRGHDGGGPSAELLRRLAHWLMKEPELEEDSLAAEVTDGRLRIVRRSVAPDPAPVTVTLPSGETTAVALEDVGDGRALGDIAAGEPGLYRLGDGRRSALAAAGALNPRELAQVTATDADLARIAADSGGGVVWLADHDGQLPDIRLVGPGRDTFGAAAGGRRPWLGLHRNGEYAVTGVTQLRLLPGLAVLAIALGALLLAWRREGR